MPVSSLPVFSGWIVTALIAVAFVLAYAGFAALSLAQERHHEAVYGTSSALTPRRTRMLRWLGTALLVAALVIAFVVWGLVVGLVAWLAMLAVAGIAQAMVLTWRPQLLRRCLGAIKPPAPLQA